MKNEIADTGHLIEVQPRTGNLFVIPAWGYLEALEVRWTPPLPNMDVGLPINVIIEPFAMGQLQPFQVFARVRDVKAGVDR